MNFKKITLVILVIGFVIAAFFTINSSDESARSAGMTYAGIILACLLGYDIMLRLRK